MKRLLLLSILATLLTGCAVTDEERIEQANDFCAFRGYRFIKIYQPYGEIEAIYCSLGEDMLTAPYTNPLENQDVPHE
ncbi:hypothetical protein D3C80_1449560 [compost metagenome]